MSKLFDFSGDDYFCPGESIFQNPKDSSLLLSPGCYGDVYFPPRKRSHISAPLVFSGEGFEKKKKPSIEVLPDECLFEIFRRLPGGQSRSASACVSKLWLMLLSSIGRDEICAKVTAEEPEERLISDKAVESFECFKKGGEVGSKGITVEPEAEGEVKEGDGYLSRCLEGKKATDVRLAAIAVGTCSRGGLGKLSIRGSNSTCGVTNFGLKAIARGCPSLRVLSLWNISSIDDEGLSYIANECHLLEKLDLCHCPAISDKALMAIAKNCPKLTSLTIEYCPNIGNESLQAVGHCSHNLNYIVIQNCPLVGDQGIASLFSSASYTLTKVKLQALDISDVSLAVIGYYGKAVTDLALIGLQNVSERGFWVMGNAQGLQKLRSFAITSCLGVTDIGLGAVGKGCPNLKQFCLRKCEFLSNNGLVSFAKAALSIESMKLEECDRISESGVFSVLVNCGGKLKALALANCLGIKDIILEFPLTTLCNSLRSVSIRNCPGFGNASLSLLGRLCPQLQYIDLSGLHAISDEGFFPLIERCEAGLRKVNLSGCVNLTDKVVSAIAKLHGVTLELLNLDGCRYVTDASLEAIAENCLFLSELDASKSAITDYGIASLACAAQLKLQILSLSGCSMVTDKCLPFLKQLGRKLVGLNVQYCHGISCCTVDLLVEQLWRCDILS